MEFISKKFTPEPNPSRVGFFLTFDIGGTNQTIYILLADNTDLLTMAA